MQCSKLYSVILFFILLAVLKTVFSFFFRTYTAINLLFFFNQNCINVLTAQVMYFLHRSIWLTDMLFALSTIGCICNRFYKRKILIIFGSGFIFRIGISYLAFALTYPGTGNFQRSNTPAGKTKF